MNLVRNMSVKVKLFSGFLICLLCIVVVSAMGMLGMRRLNDNAKEIYNYNFQSINYIHQIKESLLNIRTEIDRAVLYTDSLQTKEAIAAIEIYAEENRMYLESFEQLGHNEETQASYDKILVLLEEYRTARSNVLGLAHEGKYFNAKTDMYRITEVRLKIGEELDNLLEWSQNEAKAKNERNKNAYASLRIIILATSAIGALLAIIFGLLISLYVSKNIKNILKFAEALKAGDLTYSNQIKSKDEFGKMTNALNIAKEKIREVIHEIANDSQEVSASSEELSATLEEVAGNFEEIDQNIASIVGNIQEINATTEELAATVEQVDSGISQLTSDASESGSQSAEIQKRAVIIKSKGFESREVAKKLSGEKEIQIVNAIEQGKVVEEIAIFAESISSIADQTNLLAINAAIEAARAGEQGKGFAVVADEIRVLAERSSGYVKNIHEVVAKVKGAVEDLSVNAKDVVDFISTRVSDDYALLMDTGVSYEKDASYVSNLSNSIAAMSEELNASTQEISSVTQFIATNVGETSSNSEVILKSMQQTTIAMDQVAEAAQHQAEIAEKLTQLVSTFKI